MMSFSSGEVYKSNRPKDYLPSRERIHIPPMERETHLPSYLEKGIS